jgi:enamine deaminase RidA (YjgF/YER057c/UK114 family)
LNGETLQTQENVMQRTAVNPWPWSIPLGYNQGEVIENARRQLICAGQTSVDAEGRPLHPGDMRSQLSLALNNLESVLGVAGMGLANIIRLNIYTTDVDQALAHFDLLGARFGAAQVAPPSTLLGVSRLALPELMIEIEATAAD